MSSSWTHVSSASPDGGRLGGAAPRQADPAAVLSAINDADSRRILVACAETPLTAEECASACDVPLSTVYRKLDRLAEVDLLGTGRRVVPHRNHPQEFFTDFDALAVSLRGGVDVDLLQVATDGGRDHPEETE